MAPMSGDGIGIGGGGKSRAAKKRAKKKKRKEMMQKQAQQQQHRKKKKNGGKEEEEAAPVRDDGEEEDGSAGGKDDDRGDGMEIADVSRGELDYLSSRGIATTTSKKAKKKTTTKKKKERDGVGGDGGEAKRRKVIAASASNKAGDESGESADDEGGCGAMDGDDGEEDDEHPRAVVDVLSRLTPSEILFPASDGDDGDDDDNDGGDDDDEDEDGGRGGAQDPLSPDPKLILRDVTSKTRARVLIESLLRPAGLTAEEFYADYWEKKPLLISRPRVTFDGAANENGSAQAEDSRERHESRLDGILSKRDVERMLERDSLRYGREVNVTRYDDDGGGVKRRITLDLPPRPVKAKKAGTSGEKEGGGGGGGGGDGHQQQQDVQHVVADPNDVWSNFASGCTVRLLCPHLHSDSVHTLLSTLELEFGCMVGANAYLTPPHNSQGFAPHYDDIEAFVLQLEGRKRWRVYPPPNRGETLPRVSSRDYTDADMEGVEPVIDAVLGPGDVLYMPRGWIHQAHTPRDGRDGTNGGGGHSLHLTASAMQNWAWVDFLELIMPEALEAAASSESSTSLREGLPRDFLSYMGAMHDAADDDGDGGGIPEGLKQAVIKNDGEAISDEDDDEMEERRRLKRRKRLQHQFREEAKKRIMRVCKQAISMVDAGCDQIGKRFLSDRQPPALTPDESCLTSENRAENGGKVWPNTMCRLVRPGIARLVLEDGKAVLYHCADNSRVYHGSELSPLEFEIDDAPALEMLLTTTEPHWICVKDLIHGDIEDKMDIAQALYDEGLLAIHQVDKPDKSVQTG